MKRSGERDGKSVCGRVQPDTRAKVQYDRPRCVDATEERSVRAESRSRSRSRSEDTRLGRVR